MRTDFDSFELPAQQTTEYVVRGKIPGALQEARAFPCLCEAETSGMCHEFK